MKQIIINYVFVFVLPFLIGIAFRFFLRHARKARFATAGMVVLAAAAWLIAYAVPSHGSELYGIVALIVTCAAAGAVLVGVLLGRHSSFFEHSNK